MARIVEFEGRRIEVPDDATDAEVQQIITGQPSAQPQPQQATAAPTPTAAPAPVNQGVDAATYVLQRGNRGLADAAGAPVDLLSMGLNAGLWGVDKVAEQFGGNVDTRIEKPFGGSDWLADTFGSAYESAGGHIVPDEAVSPGVRTAGTAARGTAAALVPAMSMASGPVQAITQAGRGGSALQSLAKPYASSPGATIARDAVAGGGAGAAAQSYDDYAPDWLQDSSFSPIAKALASAIGGIGGAGLLELGEGLAKGAFNTGRNIIAGAGDPNAPVNPMTEKPFTRTEMDRAANVAQQMPTSRGQAVANIEENAQDFAQFASPSATPTTGMLADDIGMAMQENVLRSRDPQRFAERDAARRGAADRSIDRSAPAGADGRNFTAETQRQMDDVTGRQTAARDNIVRQNVEMEGYRARQPQASAAMAEDFDAARKTARGAKNAAYDAVDPQTKVDGRHIDEAVRRIHKAMPRAERMNPGPYAEIASRIRRLVTETISAEDAGRSLGDIDPTRLRRNSDGSVTIVKDITWGDLKALRAQVSEARKNAVGASGQSVAGSGADVQRLDELNMVLGHLADETNPEAARFYREEYAPRFKEGRAGEYGAAMDRASRTGGESSATRPSEFGDKFLRKPEDAASLNRAMTPIDDTGGVPRIGEGAPQPKGVDPATAQNAKEWMLGDLAKSGVLTDNAEIRFDKFKRWVDKNRATIDQFPDLAKTVDEELARAQRGGALSKQLAAEVAEAKRTLGPTLDRSPANAVAGVMGSGDPEKRMGELVERLSGDMDATDGLKAAMRDWIKDKTGTTAKIVGDPDATRLSRANLEKLFNEHEGTLAKVYSPDEMNALRQAHKLMGAEAKLDVRATAGSNTYDKIVAGQKADATQKKRVLEAALKAKFGVLKGGGIFRTMNLFLESLPDGNRGLEDILFEMHFNPELAKHLLTRPVKDVGSPGWNARLNALMATATGARESVESDEP